MRHQLNRALCLGYSMNWVGKRTIRRLSFLNTQWRAEEWITRCVIPYQSRWSSLRSNRLDKLKGQSGNCLNTLFTRGCKSLFSPMVEEWHFFHPSGEGDYRERLVYQLDLIETDSGESTERLDRYLNYDLVCNGAASQAIADDYRDIHKQRVIKTNLPEAWIKLVEEADEFLLHTVAENGKSMWP